MDYITVVGSLNYDIIFKQKRLPRMGETYPADSVTFSGGGKGANQAVQCAKLGVPTYMVGKTGEDTFGTFLEQELKRYGVNTDYLQKSGCNTGIGNVNVLEDGTVFATIVPGANDDYRIEELKKLEKLISESRILILQMEIPVHIVEALINMAAAVGVYILLNAAPAREIAADALAKVDCLVVNETEASFYGGLTVSDEDTARKAGAVLLEKVKGSIIITLGEHGSLLCSRGKMAAIAPVVPDKVVETTGAGDSYIGAFAYGKMNKMEDEAACHFAARAAAVTIAGIGAQPSMPYEDQLK